MQRFTIHHAPVLITFYYKTSSCTYRIRSYNTSLYVLPHNKSLHIQHFHSTVPAYVFSHTSSCTYSIYNAPMHMQYFILTFLHIQRGLAHTIFCSNIPAYTFSHTSQCTYSIWSHNALLHIHHFNTQRPCTWIALTYNGSLYTHTPLFTTQHFPEPTKKWPRIQRTLPPPATETLQALFTSRACVANPYKWRPPLFSGRGAPGTARHRFLGRDLQGVSLTNNADWGNEERK